MKNDKNLVSSLVGAIPQALLQERADRLELLSTLTKRRDGYHGAVSERASKIEALEAELARLMAAGGDGAETLKRINRLREEAKNMERLIGMVEEEISKAEDSIAEIKNRLSGELSRVVLEKRLIIAAELETKISEIEDDLNTWRTATSEAAASVDCDLQAGTDVFVKSRILRDHLI